MLRTHHHGMFDAIQAHDGELANLHPELAPVKVLWVDGAVAGLLRGVALRTFRTTG